MKDSKDIIFVHIPRTAGTSIANALGIYKKHHRHFFARKYIAIRPDWDDCFKFSFVRNPWDRAVSLYAHQTKCSNSFKDWLMDIVKRDGHPKIRKKEWVLRDKMASTGGSSLPWKCQTDWLVNNSGQLCMDFIGKFENLNVDIKKIEQIIGRKILLPHHNKTDRLPYQHYYDDETRKIVADWHRKDIENFGYKFESMITYM
jgi:hypothetical protein